MTHHEMADGADSIDTLRRVKEAEEQAEQRLAAARAEGAALLDKVRAQALEALAQVKSAGEAARSSSVATARSQAEAEAAALLAEGRKAAALIEMKASQAVAARREKVLPTVLGSFKPAGED